jgi:hypothetical protein
MAKTKSRTRSFVVPKEFLSSFFQRLEESELEFELKEVDEDGDLNILVSYSTAERNEIMNLVELEDEYYEIENNEVNQEEEEEDED